MPLKRELLELLLQRSHPWVAVDTTFFGIDLPPHLREQGIVNFRLVFEDGPQIPDLKLTDEGWSATLSFGGSIYHVRVPWGACVQFSDGPTRHSYVMVFETEKPTLKDLPPITTPPPKKPTLGVIKGEKS